MTQLSALVYWACVSVVTSLALGKGGRPEQVATMILIIASALVITQTPDPHTSYRQVEWGLLAIDAGSFGAFATLALLANRYWPPCIAGMKLIPISGHLAKMAAPAAVAPRTYAIMGEIWTYTYMIVIIVAVFRHQRRLKRHGVDEDWRRSLR